MIIKRLIEIFNSTNIDLSKVKIISILIRPRIRKFYFLDFYSCLIIKF